jgi:hypothetical protein
LAEDVVQDPQKSREESRSFGLLEDAPEQRVKIGEKLRRLAD